MPRVSRRDNKNPVSSAGKQESGLKRGKTRIRSLAGKTRIRCQKQESGLKRGKTGIRRQARGNRQARALIRRAVKRAGPSKKV